MKSKPSFQLDKSLVHSGYYFGQDFPSSQDFSFPYPKESFSCYSEPMETTGERFERVVVELLAEIIESRNLKPARLGKLAFKGERARKVVKQLTKGYQFKSAAGKKMRLRVSDLYDLCLALDETPSEILTLASHRLKAQSQSQNVITLAEKKEERTCLI